MSDNRSTRPGPRPVQGFTLIELAVVLVAVGLLIGGLLLVLSKQVELHKLRQTQRQLDEVRDALMGFAAATGRLPCPSTVDSRGAEVAVQTGGNYGCASSHGFVPAATLGLPGARNDDGLLTDAWGNPYRYSVSRADSGPNGRWDFITPGEMRGVGMASLKPDLTVCSEAAATVGTGACDVAGSTVVGDDGGTAAVEVGVPAVLYSLGPNGTTYISAGATPSVEERENAGEYVSPPYDYVTGPVTNNTYFMANDAVFVARQVIGDNPTTPGLDETFDDLVDWISPNVLYSRMIAAGQLP